MSRAKDDEEVGGENQSENIMVKHEHYSIYYRTSSLKSRESFEAFTLLRLMSALAIKFSFFK